MVRTGASLIPHELHNAYNKENRLTLSTIKSKLELNQYLPLLWALCNCKLFHDETIRVRDNFQCHTALPLQCLLEHPWKQVELVAYSEEVCALH